MNNEETDKVQETAIKISELLGAMVNDEQISPPEVVVGAVRGVTAFWMGCIQDGARVEALTMLKAGMNEEIDNMIRGISNGMVPA
jgi:hypothetical protein